MKKRKKKKEIYTDGEVCVLLEDIKDKFDFLADGQAILKKDLSEVKKKADINFEEIGKLRVDVTILRKDVDILKKDVSVLKKDVSILKEDVSILKKDVSVLKEDMDYVKDELGAIRNELKAKVSREEFTLLKKKSNC
ncbi:hypothetical protein J7J37_01885 [bacterium]|nr:hypothetical protein [bacterium]